MRFTLGVTTLLSVAVIQSLAGKENTTTGPLCLEWTPVIGTLEQISVGPAGVWGVEQDGRLFYRNESRGMDGSKGHGEWEFVFEDPEFQNLTSVDVGTDVVWGIGVDGRVLVRIGIDEVNPIGCGWVILPEIMSQVTVSPNGHVWAVGIGGEIYRRVGANNRNRVGDSWQRIGGSLKGISAGGAGVWGVDKDGAIFYRIGTFNDVETAGGGWINATTSLDGQETLLESISSGDGKVWGVDKNNNIFFRAGLSFATPSGMSWFQGPGRMLQVDVWEGSAWAISTKNMPQVYARLASQTIPVKSNW